MTLGGRDNGFRPRINHPHRLAKMPSGQRNEGLNGKIELGAETAADSARNNTYCLGGDPENPGDVGAIHVRGLGAGLNLDLVVYAPGKAGLRLYVGVFDKAGLVFAFDHDIRFLQSLFHVATDHAATHQQIIFTVRMDTFGIGSESGFNRGQRREFLPFNRKARGVESFDGRSFSHHGGDCFTSEPGFSFSKHRLVRKTRNHAVHILSRYIFRS